MTASATKKSTRLRITYISIAIAALVVAMVVVGFGSANLASLSGELPVDDPTPVEIATWETGHTLLWLAFVITTAAGVVLALAATTLRKEWVLISIVGGFAICYVSVGLVAIGTWFVVLPRIVQ